MIGQARSFNLDDEASPTGVGMSYRVIRRTEKEFDVVLDLQFLDARTMAPSRDGVYREAVHRAMRERVERCFQTVESALFAPDGRRIRIRFPDPGEAGVPKVKINVRSASGTGAFADSGNYLEDAKCHSILHEVGHLLGLVDQYDPSVSAADLDRTTGRARSAETNGREAACRALGPPNSLMTSHQAAFARVYRRLSDPEPGAVPREGESLFDPAYFDVILNPGCPVNRDFYACARQAYRKADARGRCSEADLPASCRGGRQDWTGRR